MISCHTQSVVVLKGLSVSLTVKNAFAPIICTTVVGMLGLDGRLKDLPSGFYWGRKVNKQKPCVITILYLIRCKEL